MSFDQGYVTISVDEINVGTCVDSADSYKNLRNISDRARYGNIDEYSGQMERRYLSVGTREKRSSSGISR